MTEWRHMDRITVLEDGEEVEVFNHVSVEQKHYVRPGGYDSFNGRIGRGDDPTNKRPLAVTPAVTDMLSDFGIDPASDYGIRTIDPDSQDVEVI